MGGSRPHGPGFYKAISCNRSSQSLYQIGDRLTSEESDQPRPQSMANSRHGFDTGSNECWSIANLYGGGQLYPFCGNSFVRGYSIFVRQTSE